MAPSHAVPDEPDLRALMGKIEREHGLALSGYKRPCLRRRLAVRMRAHGVQTFAAYADILDRVPGEYDRLLDALTITVTKFFRNPESYAVLRERVVASLGRSSEVRVWSAGCASGEEPYSLALLFAEWAGTRGAARLARRLNRLSGELHHAIGIGERAGLLREGGRRQHDVGEVRGLGEEDVLHH